MVSCLFIVLYFNLSHFNPVMITLCYLSLMWNPWIGYRRFMNTLKLHAKLCSCMYSQKRDPQIWGTVQVSKVRQILKPSLISYFKVEGKGGDSFYAQVGKYAENELKNRNAYLNIIPLFCNKVSGVPHLAQSLFLGKMWNFYFERPGLAFNLMMRILVSKAFTLPSAIPTTG